MKFAIRKQLFGQAVRSAHAFGNSAGTRQRTDFRYPVDLVATPLGLEISAFNGTALLTQRVPAGVSAPGSVSIDTGELRDALARANARDVVTFEARSEHGDAEMAACRLLDSGKATALGRAPTGRSGYCHMALGGQLEARLEAPAAELAAIVAETAFAASTDPSRQYLNGLFIESHHGRLRAVATDGSRMAIRDTNIRLTERAGKAGLPISRFAVQRLLEPAGGTAAPPSLPRQVARDLRVLVAIEERRFRADNAGTDWEELVAGAEAELDGEEAMG